VVKFNLFLQIRAPNRCIGVNKLHLDRFGANNCTLEAWVGKTIAPEALGQTIAPI